MLDYAEKERENLSEFARKKMQGKDITKLKPKSKEQNITVKETISQNKPIVFKKKPKNTKPVTSDASTKVLRTLLGTLLPDQAAQFLTAITTKDSKLGLQDLTPDIREAVIKSVKNAQKRTGKNKGGTEYIDYSSEVKKAFQGMSAGKKQMLSTDPDIQAATMLGRVSYKKNALGETEIYDSYDFSKTNPQKADTFYKKVRAYTGVALPDEGKQPNLIGKIPVEEPLAFGTNQDGIMKRKMNPIQKYAFGTGIEGMDLLNFDDTLMQEETPAQKALRERREARAIAVSAQKAKNAIRLAPIEADQQVRFENWRNSSPDNISKTYEDWQTGLVKAQNKPDAVLPGLEIDKAKKGYTTKGSCTTDTKIEKVKLAGGTGAKGINPNNYIVSPAEALNDYDIMMAKVENQAMSNPWLPIVAAVGGAAQSFVGNAGMLTKKPGEGDDADADAAMGMNNVQQDVEVEGGEMYETPQGETGEFQGPSHEEGGIPLEVGQDVQEGTKVYSDRLKVGDKTLAERKATRERQTANLEKIASQPLVDQAVKNATKRKMMVIQKEEMADLDFQEKVNNMQQMADTMVAAFGTGMAGLQANPIGESMRYAGGTGVNGVRKMVVGGTIGEPELDQFGNPIVKPVVNLESMMVSPGVSDLGISKTPKFKLTGNSLADFAANPREYMKTTITPDTYFKDTNNVKTFQDWMDTNNSNWLSTGKSLNKGSGYGNYGPNTKKAAGTNFEAFKTSLLPKETPVTPTDYGAGDFLSAFKTTEVPNTTATVAKTGETAEKEAEKPTAMGNLMRGLPGMGDMTKLIGNYLGMTSGIKTATEQRASDVTNTNVYKNAGEEAQRLLDNAKQGIETSKAQAIVKANANTRTGKKGARNSARGVNQMRGMDWLYDTALNTTMSDIIAGAAQQMVGIDTQKSGVSMNADQLKGQGEWQAKMANTADKDAYYTALGKGREQFATGLQQSGKDINDMKENKVVQNLMKQYGKYFSADDSGNLGNKNVASTKEKEQIVIGPDGKTKFKVGKNNQLIPITT
jgi:hypothetical protein